MHSSPNRAASSVMPLLLALFIALGGCASDGDDRLAIVVQVEGLRPEITALDIAAALDGALAENAIGRISENLQEFVVYLPPTTQGMLSLDIGALGDVAACHLGRAQVQVMVQPAPPRVVRVTASLQNAEPALCPLTINLSGDGTLEAGGGALWCSSKRCRGVFPKDTTAMLTALPGLRSSNQTMWSNAPLCVTPALSCTVQVTRPLEIGATFTSPPCLSSGVCPYNAQVDTSNLRGVHHGGPDDVWVSGYQGIVTHFDGRKWTPAALTAPTDGIFFSVRSRGANDVVAMGGAMGTSGFIFAFDGTRWSQVASTVKNIRSAWLWSATSATAVGDSGLIFSRAASGSWAGNEMTMPGTAYHTIWSSGNAFYVVGTGGFIGAAAPGAATASRQTSNTTNSLFSIFGTSDSDMWAVGDMGTLVHYDGSAWTLSPQSSIVTTNQLNGVWGTAPNNYWAVGNSGTILHYDGTSWMPVTSGTTAHLQAVSGSSASDVWMVGDLGTVLHHTGL